MLKLNSSNMEFNVYTFLEPLFAKLIDKEEGSF